MVNQDYKVLNNTKDSLPLSSSVTGTVDSSGIKVSGTGTDFQAELEEGDWLVDLSQNEARKIVSIDDRGQFLQLNKGFTADLSGATVRHIPWQEVNMREISVSNDGAADATLNGANFVVGTTATFDQNDGEAKGQHGYAEPVVVDATGTVVSYLIKK